VAAPTLSVVIPVHDEAAHLPTTVAALVAAVEESGFLADVVVVDDGSSDGSAAVAQRALAGRLPLQVVTQPNRGRFEARRAGLERARGEHVLLLDGRVRVRPGSLAHVERRLAAGEVVWTADVRIDVGGNPFATFQNVLTEIAWRDYFERPRALSFDESDFDRYPKGTTCFFAPRELVVAAVHAFASRYADTRDANDDTPLLRWVSARERIHLSPDFGCEYTARGTLGSFLRHSVHRGTVFLDGHGRRESRFFPLAVASFPVTAGVALACLARPRSLRAVVLATSAGAAAIALRTRRSRSEVVTVAGLAPVWAAAFAVGLWRGLVLQLAHRARG